MSDESKFEDFLQRESKGYKMNDRPPADAIWQHIERDVAEAIDPFRRRRRESRRRWLVIGSAIAATLLFGVVMGRWSAGGIAPTQQTAATPRTFVDDSVRITEHARAATVAHLEETEVFLTTVRADLRARRAGEDLSGRSRELLTRTRLLLDARGERSPQVSQLLQDLELLLAEIAALSNSPRAMDVKLLDESMRQGDILPRIRTTLPAPSAGT